jgi:hypothetical protein
MSATIRQVQGVGAIIFACAAFLVSLSGQAAPAACPPGTVKVGEHREETPDAIIIHPICQEVAPSVRGAKSPTSETESPCNRGDSSQPASGTVSPAMFVTEAQCESAFSDLVRLQKQRDNLTAKIAQLQQWSTGLRTDEKEFEQMRSEAQEDLGWEFIDHVPVAQGLDALKGNPALNGLNVDKVKAAYGAVKGLLETGRGISAKDEREQEQKIIDGNRELRNAMIETAALNEQSKALLVAVSKVITYGATIAVAANADKMSDRDKLKTVMSLVEALQPLWGLGVLGENIAERGVQHHEAGVALDSLHEAQSSNWNAQRYLTEKLNRVNDEAKEEQVLVDKYQMANDEAH